MTKMTRWRMRCRGISGDREVPTTSTSHSTGKSRDLFVFIVAGVRRRRRRLKRDIIHSPSDSSRRCLLFGPDVFPNDDDIQYFYPSFGRFSFLFLYWRWRCLLPRKNWRRRRNLGVVVVVFILLIFFVEAASRDLDLAGLPLLAAITASR